MKHIRITALSLALVLMLGLFAACGKSPSGSESGSASQPDVSISQPQEDLSTPDVSAPDASQPEEETPAPEVKPEEKPQSKPQQKPEEKPEEKPQAPAPEVKPEEPTPEAKPEEPAPEQKPEEPAPEAPSIDHTQRYVNALNNSGCELLQYNQIFTPDSADSALALEFVGLTPDVVGQFAISFSMMNTKAFGLAAIMPAEGQQQAVVDGLNSYIARMKQTFERYLPDQYEVACNAKVATLSDGTVILAMCDDQDTVLANIKSQLG